MSLRRLLSPVLSQLPDVPADMQVEVLREIPTETLYLALKNADSETILWFFQNALPEQVQGLIDIDCWQGDQFLPERFEPYFKSLTLISAPKLAVYMDELDSEILVRALLEYCEIADFDPQNPPEVEEGQILFSPDNKYALLLKTERPDLKEMLFLWLNKFSAANLELMRRHLESCKWEQLSDLEEFSYQIKKGRMEEMGFVDDFEAKALYSVGQAAELKKSILASPLPPHSKSQKPVSEEGAELSIEFLPQALEKSLYSEGFFSEALTQLRDHNLKVVLLQELLRVINASLSADGVIHHSLDLIAEASLRARRYIDLGLSFLSDGQVPTATQCIEQTPLQQIYRLGWLVIQDIVKAEAKLGRLCGPNFFGNPDDILRAKLKGRHPRLSPEEIADLGPSGSTWPSSQAAFLLGSRLTELFHLALFFQKDLGQTLHLSATPPKREADSAYIRLMTALFREAGGAEFAPTPITRVEWPAFVKNFDAKRFEKSLALIASRVPGEALALFQKRSAALQEEIFRHAKFPSAPDPRFFKGLLLQKENS